MTKSIKDQMKLKCADKTTEMLIDGYTLLRMIKIEKQSTDQWITMIVVGEVIEERIGEDAFDALIDEIDAVKFAIMPTSKEIAA